MVARKFLSNVSFSNERSDLVLGECVVNLRRGVGKREREKEWKNSFEEWKSGKPFARIRGKLICENRGEERPVCSKGTILRSVVSRFHLLLARKNSSPRD